MDTAGTKVTSSSTQILQSRNGDDALNTLMIDIPEILLPTLRHIPTGGVTSPIASPTTRIIPNVISLIPSAVNTGRRIGAIRRMHGTTSRKVPRASTRTAGQQKKTIEDLRKGMVDIVVGTHRL